MKFNLFILACICVLSISCDKESCTKEVSQELLDLTDKNQLAIDQQLIEDYISTNNLGPTQEVNGITYIVEKEGNGDTPCLENEVTVIYKGRLMSDGSVFDLNNVGVTFALKDLILGWQLSFPSFSKGTKATIYIPSVYAYGKIGFSPRIPPNANLIFEIEMVNFR
ncbi:MAG: FKBP-type peptidyl-prolyl cis-trans isomerase [Cyclobacteriaceae bacterium]